MKREYKAGHKIKEGSLLDSYLTDSDLWSVFANVFSTNSKKSTSYKFVFLKSILENLYSVDKEGVISFENLFTSFTRIYWNLVVLNNLKQGPNGSAVANVILKEKEKYNLLDGIAFDSIETDLRVKIVKRVISPGKQNVLGALYGDTSGKVYAFNKETGFFQLHKNAIIFMRRNQRILTSLNHYHLARFLEQVNSIPETCGINEKIVYLSKRKNLDSIYKLLIELDEEICFYCKKTLSKDRKKHT